MFFQFLTVLLNNEVTVFKIEYTFLSVDLKDLNEKYSSCFPVLSCIRNNVKHVILWRAET